MSDSSGSALFVAPYEILAYGYDLVMAHVDYASWSTYIHQLIQRFGTEPNESVLELGCGTGLLALDLQPLADYRYLGLDMSPNMIAVARHYAQEEGLPLQFEVADFREFEVDQSFDVAFLLQDGINYLLEEEEIAALFERAYLAIRPGGVFIFDQSTPANSINNAAYFDDEDKDEDFEYQRRSTFDADTRIHETHFTIEFEGETYIEHHVQKAYSMDEMRAIVERSGFVTEAMFDGLTTTPATPETERIHWVLRRPTP